jgi:hypothetical protein
MERNTNLKMTELVCDYIKDPADIWWLIGVKAFKLEETQAKPILRAFIPHLDYLSLEDDDDKKKDKYGRLKSANKDNTKSEYVKLRICRFC